MLSAGSATFNQVGANDRVGDYQATAISASKWNNSRIAEGISYLNSEDSVICRILNTWFISVANEFRVDGKPVTIVEDRDYGLVIVGVDVDIAITKDSQCAIVDQFNRKSFRILS